VSADISERKAAEESIRRLNAELQNQSIQLRAANKELEAFSYSVSHDLRAPLRSIDGFSQALLEDYADKLDEEGQNSLQRVRASSQHMAQLIDDMLKLSRVTRSEMRREPVDLTGMAQALAADLQNTAPERQVKFVIADGLLAQGDAALLRIAMENLLDNAWKYTSQRPRAQIEFGFCRNNGRSAYFVRDDGAGFDMAYADKLFGTFQRLHSVTEFKGTGIGLATVQRIIHRHGGHVWAEAKVNQGATFYFTL
jgi:light-regulated signal transduction histidine kinase (bacteriophytochrome)